MLASLKVTGWPLLAGALGFAGGYHLHAALPDASARERSVVVTQPATPALTDEVAGRAATGVELSSAKAAAMSSGVVLGGEIAQPLPAY